MVYEKIRQFLYLECDHARIVMAAIIAYADPEKAILDRPSGYHIRVHRGPAMRVKNADFNRARANRFAATRVPRPVPLT